MGQASPTSSADLVSWAGTHRCMGYLARCSAYKPALDPQDSRVHIEPSEPYKHRSLEYTSDVCYDPARSLTGAGFWGWGGENGSYSGIDACVRGKGREISQQRGFEGGEKEGH